MSDNYFKIKRGLNLEPKAADPVDGAEGDTYFNSTSDRIRVYRNSAWRDVAAELDLSNLTSTAINVSLVPGTDNAINLGSAAKRFTDLFGVTIKGASGSAVSIANRTLISSGGYNALDWENGIHRSASDGTNVAILDSTGIIIYKNILPQAGLTGTLNLGGASNQFNDLYLDNNIVLTNTKLQLGASASAAGTNATALGTSSSAGGTRAISLGYSATNGASTTDCIVIGSSASSSASASNSVIIGGSASTSTSNSVLVGNSTVASTGSSVAIGNSASAAGGVAIGSSAVATTGVAIGNGTTASSAAGVAIGIGAAAGYAYSIALGSLSSVSESNMLSVGSSNPTYRIGKVVIGDGTDKASTPSDVTLKSSPVTGTNIAGGNLLISAGESTGNANGGRLKLQTAIAGAPGSGLRAAVSRFEVKPDGQVKYVNLGADPSNAEIGDLYYNSVANAFKYYDGAWRTLANTAASFADLQLSNLSGTTSIPVDLLPSASGKDLGSAGSSWADLYVTDAYVAGNLTVSGTTTTVNTATLEVEDANILVNNGGNDASSEGAGVTVERTGTSGSIIYANAATSRFKIGDLGAEVEVVTTSGAQAISGKTQIDVDNLRLNGNTISSTDSGGHLILSPEHVGGPGKLKLDYGVGGINYLDVVNAATIDLFANLGANTLYLGGGSGGAIILRDAFSGTASALYLSGTFRALLTVDAALTGSAQTATAATPYVKFTNGSLASVIGISSPTAGQIVKLTNGQSGTIVIVNDGGGPADTGIITGTGANIQLKAGASLEVVYDNNSSRWRVIGGTGSASLNVANKVFGDSPYTVAASDDYIGCDATSGNMTLNLPAVATSSGKVYHIKKKDSSANTITIDGNSSETIDGNTTYVLTAQYESISIVSDGSVWNII